MTCKGCPKGVKNPNRDRMGNIKGTESEMEEYEQRVVDDIHKSVRSFTDYLSDRKRFREERRESGLNALKLMPEDYKRIRLHELISIYNYEEIEMGLAPTQALVALWELGNTKEYEKVFEEFTGLKEQVEERYQELVKNKIIINYNK